MRHLVLIYRLQRPAVERCHEGRGRRCSASARESREDPLRLAKTKATAEGAEELFLSLAAEGEA